MQFQVQATSTFPGIKTTRSEKKKRRKSQGLGEIRRIGFQVLAYVVVRKALKQRVRAPVSRHLNIVIMLIIFVGIFDLPCSRCRQLLVMISMPTAKGHTSLGAKIETS